MKILADREGFGASAEYMHRLSRAVSLYGGAWTKYAHDIERLNFGTEAGVRLRW